MYQYQGLIPMRVKDFYLFATLNSCSTDFHAINTSVHVKIYIVLASCRFTSCSGNHRVRASLLVVTEVLQINRIVAESTKEKIDAQQTKMKDAQQWVLSASMQNVVCKESTSELISIKGVEVSKLSVSALCSFCVAHNISGNKNKKQSCMMLLIVLHA